MYIAISNQVICGRRKGPSDRNTLNIINSNVMRSPKWWQILSVNVVQNPIGGQECPNVPNWFAMVRLVWRWRTYGEPNWSKSKPISHSTKPIFSWSKPILSNCKPACEPILSNCKPACKPISSHPNLHSIPCKPFANPYRTFSGFETPVSSTSVSILCESNGV